MQTIQVVVVQRARPKEEATPYHLGDDEPIYGGPFEERPYNLQGDELLKGLGFHRLTCLKYLCNTFN